jgi:histidinol-phosphate phosphatase family protein
MQAVILAGGKGTRLASRLNGKPKPLVDVGGVPLLQRQITALGAQGVDRFVVLVNHAADQIEAFLRDHDDFGLQIEVVDDGEPRGTAGAVLACLERLDDEFLVVYGDTLFNIDIDRFTRFHEGTGAVATLFLHPNDHPHDSDLVEIDRDGHITRFHPYPHPPGALLPNLVNAAFYLARKSALTPYADAAPPLDFAKDLFPRMLADGARLAGYSSFEYIKDLGTPARLDKVEKQLATGLVERSSLKTPQACVLFDRDGTLNLLRDYVRRPADLELIPGAARALRRINDAGLRSAVISNQPVLARGECSFEDMQLIHNKLETLLAEEGAFLDRIYFCPHHPDSGFPGERPELKIACDCRKPATGMLRQAAADLNLDVRRSWFVGDSSADVKAASAFGLKSILVGTGEGGRDGKYPATPDFTAPDIAAAVTLILDLYPAMARMAAPLVEEILPGDLLLVGGLARSGKSTMAAVIASELRLRGHEVCVLPLDRWIRSAEDRAEGLMGRYDADLARATLRPWMEGAALEDAAAPFYDRQRRRSVQGPALCIGKDAVFVLEGVPALLLNPDTQRRTRRVFIRGDEGLRGARMRADYVDRTGATAEDAAAAYAARQADEASLVAGGGEEADFIFSLDGLRGGSAR